MVFCKLTACDWNKWDNSYKRHVCSKAHQYLDVSGECELAPHMRKTPTCEAPEGRECKASRDRQGILGPEGDNADNSQN